MRLAVVVSLLALGCSRGTQGQTAQPASQAGVRQAVPVAAMAGAPQGGEAPSTVSGTVIETMDSGGYTYLSIRTGGGDVWAAVNQAPVKKGAQVAVVNAMPMTGFESKTLKRTFDRIYFGSLAASAESAPLSGAPAAADPHAAASMGAQHAAAASGPADVGTIRVEKADGPSGKTVAEIWAGRASLKDKQVAVRGKVVKYNAGIMGKNWLHLQDGSGDAKAGTNDITVTSNDGAAKGDTVTVTGVVRTDKDFGSGYSYAVLVEDAKVVKK